VNDRYLHQRPMIFTTNKPLAAWGLVLHDPDIAERSSTACSSVGAISSYGGAPTAPATRRLTSPRARSHHRRDPPEFPEITRQSFRNLQRSRSNLERYFGRAGTNKWRRLTMSTMQAISVTT
jgi:hypothetical protein